MDVYQKIDMRTQTYDVPPQEVTVTGLAVSSSHSVDITDPDQGQRHRVRERHHVLQGDCVL